MLKLSSVTKDFGALRVLDNLNFSIPSRGVFGLIGPNGAGKTTVFNLITGLLPPSSGSIEFSGERLNGLPPFMITRRGIARTFQNIRLFKDMTAEENVLVAMGEVSKYDTLRALLPGGYRDGENSQRASARELLSRVGLSAKARQLAAFLSYGEQRRLELARALATRPKLLLLDEPAAGMNAAEKQQLMEEIQKLEASGLSIVLIEHDMRFVMGICAEIAVLNFGRWIAQGTPTEIRVHPKVIEAYLGSNDAGDI
ncbi:MAG TPA: ABC transporter ATP-binding protein [Candidatus Binatia bacterium]